MKRSAKKSRRYLRKRADWRTLSLLAGLTAGYAWNWKLGGAWLTLPCLVLAITACAAKHNHVHCATFGHRMPNILLDLWLTLLTGSSTTGIRVAHQVRHHGKSQSPEDFVRCAVVAEMPPLRALLLYVPRVVMEGWRHRALDFGAARRHGLQSSLFWQRLLLWAFIGTGLLVDWTRFAQTFALPWLGSQWFLIAINLPQHDGCHPESRWAHSRDVLGRLPNWFFLNNGYHSAHHDHPARHWSELRDLHQREIAPHQPPHLACASLWSFWRTWWRQRRTGRSALNTMEEGA